MAAGVAEQVDGQFKDNTTALCSLHCTQRAEAARLRQLMLRIDECFIFLFFLCLRQTRLAGGCIMFSSCPSVRPFVRSLLYFWTRYFESEWTSFDSTWHTRPKI